MAIMNQWGDDLDESIGDVIYDSLEAKAKQEAKDLAKDGIEAGGKAAVKALDKVTDHISPVKTVKDKVKEKLSNNPITRAKAAVRKLKEKAKNAVKKVAREGIQAVGRAAVAAVKALGRFMAANPVATAVIIIVIILLMKIMGDMDTDISTSTSDNVSTSTLESPIYANVDNSSTMTDDEFVIILMSDCVRQQYDTMNEMVDVEKEEKAKNVFSIFHSYGFNNASIAAILGNLDKESGIDSSAIEGIFSEYGILGTKKAAALLSLTNYTENTLFPNYRADGTSFSRDNYKSTDSEGRTVYYCGIGLAQWTGDNAKMLLTAAENINMNWYDIDFQLGYMSSDCLYRPNFFSTWINEEYSGLTDDDYDDWYNDYTSGMTDEEIDALDSDTVASDWEDDVEESWLEAVDNSAIYFVHGYEGNTAYDDERKEAARVWWEIIKEWDDETVDTEYVDSIGDLAANLGAIIDFIEIENAQYRCLSGNVFDNSSLAAAAISLAWPTRDQSYNNGTNLYITVHDTIFKDDHYYKSCDRTVACAVRWSGTDDTYPIGNTATQLRYLETSSKWEKVGSASSLSYDDLLPGDIFCLNGHTFIYVGTEAIQSAYAGEASTSSDSVSGSKNERSPGCDASATGIMNRNGQDWGDLGIYNVYRCSNPDNSTTYSNIGSGMSN